jgi:hypothetical protein
VYGVAHGDSRWQRGLATAYNSDLMGRDKSIALSAMT